MQKQSPACLCAKVLCNEIHLAAPLQLTHLHFRTCLPTEPYLSWNIQKSGPKPHFKKMIGQDNGPAYDIKNKLKTTMCCLSHIVRAYQCVSSGFQTLHFLIQLLSCRVYNSPLTSSLISLAAPSDDKKTWFFPKLQVVLAVQMFSTLSSRLHYLEIFMFHLLKSNWIICLLITSICIR